MSTHRRRISLIFLSTAMLSSLGFSSYAHSDGASITITDPAAYGKTVDVEFSEEDLKRVQEDASFVIRKLRENGTRCIEPRRKISDCIWECGDGNQIRTCNQILTKALDELGGNGT